MQHRIATLLGPLVALGHALTLGLASAPREARAGFAFSGVASGDMTSNDVILWTRGLNSAAPANTALVAEVSTDPSFQSSMSTYNGTTDASRDYTLKVDATTLQSGTKYYYRFLSPDGTTSQVGTFQTAPDPTASVPLHFGFSGDTDGRWRPYPVTSGIPSKNLNFFVYLGDTIYETASTGSPATSDPVKDPSQALADYHRKYLENLQPPPGGGDPGLQAFYAGQGNYTLLDNHELGNKQLQSGGAPQGTPAGAGVDSANPANDVNTTGAYLNQTTAFKTLVQAYSDYQPIREQTVVAPNDPRSNGTLQQYFEQQWGKNAMVFQLDDRSYRDIRLTTSTGADDTGPRADNPDRTMLGQTQLSWFETNLLKAQQQGTAWKFVLISSPIDQTGADGGKSWAGGYRFERNEILKFIADNHIQNVVFLTTDDHQTRVSELQYQPDPSKPNSYAIVPGAFQVLTGPLGAGGPDAITNHSFANIQALTNALVQQQIAKGVPVVGLDPNIFPVYNVYRQGDPTASASPQPVDFYSPDTFAYTTFDLSADGKTLTTDVWGIPSYAANTFPSASSLPSEQRILSFSLTAEGAVPAPSSAIMLALGLALVWGSRLGWSSLCLAA